MTTKLIGIKEFRNNITSLWKKAHEKQIRYIVMYHTMPILEVKPMDEDDLIVEKFGKEILEASEKAKTEKTYTDEEVRKILGLKPYVEKRIYRRGKKRSV